MDTKSKQQADAGDATSVREQAHPPLPEGENRETLLDYYSQMVLVRHFEEKAGEMYNRARIGGYCHLNLGEEATVVGFSAGLAPDDYVYTNYREHGYAICRGISPKAVMAELFGKETGCSRGRGGSMHLFDLQRHFLGGYAIVGGQLPLATGAAFALAYRGAHEIVACQMGDGTTSTFLFTLTPAGAPQQVCVSASSSRDGKVIDAAPNSGCVVLSLGLSPGGSGLN